MGSGEMYFAISNLTKQTLFEKYFPDERLLFQLISSNNQLLTIAAYY